MTLGQGQEMTYIDVKTDQQYEGWSEVLILPDQFQAVCALLRHVRSIRKDNDTSTSLRWQVIWRARFVGFCHC